MLSVGLGLGQGSLFLVNSLLVGRGDYHRLADFGLAFNFATLFLLAVDAGSITTLARDTSLARRSPDFGSTISTAYAATTAVRLLVATSLSVCGLVYGNLAGEGFVGAYAITGSLGPLLWAFNFSGILDGVRRSGVAGISSVSIYLLSALGVLFTMGLPDREAGLLLGACLSLGAAGALAAQLLSVRAAGVPLAAVLPDKDSLKAAVKDGGMMLLYTIPGQLFIRAQIILATALLGPIATGLFVYGKQVSSGLAQVIHFARRDEFPDLASAFSRRGELSVNDAFSMQRTSLGVTLAAVIAVALGFLLVSHTIFPSMRDAANGVLILLPLVLSSAVVATLSFALMASRRYGLTVWPAMMGLIGAVPLSYFAALAWGFAGLAIAEGIAHIVTLVLLLRFFPRHRVEVAVK